jgi:drug/metabolite transporter (DMT)-like permease
LVAAFGVFLIAARPETSRHSAEELLITGIIYAVFGALFAVVYAVTLFLPRASWNWIVGIIMIALGLTSCCFAPFLIPLLIFWLKPETKAYFGRN